MSTAYWLKQGSEPLFPKLEWNKPERRDQAGRLLIIGGNLHALEAPAKAYAYSKSHGIGEAKIALPDKTKRLVGQTLLDAVFLPSTNSGEFASGSESELLSYAHWADTALLAGDVGRNSQTSLLLENLVSTFTGQMIITKDVLESLGNSPKLLFQREKTTLVASFSQLQRLIKEAGIEKPLQFSMTLVQLVDYLHAFTSEFPASIVTQHQNQIVAASRGDVATTKLAHAIDEPAPWRLQFASITSCYQTWYPSKPHQALVYSSHIFNKIKM